MNLLSRLSFGNCENSFVQFVPDECDRLTAKFQTPYDSKEVCYIISSDNNPLDDLLDATVKLLTHKPYSLYSNPPLKNYAFYKHFLDGVYFIWILHYTPDEMKMMIWENQDIDIPLDLIDVDFDDKKYRYQYYETPPDLKEGLVFALKDTPFRFAEFVFNIINTTASVFPKKHYNAPGWQELFSPSFYKRLSEWLKESSAK